MRLSAVLGALTLLVVSVGCGGGESDRIARLEGQVAALRAEVNSLKAGNAGAVDSPKSTPEVGSQAAGPGGAAANPDDVKYVGSVNSNKFHYPWCTAANRIRPENLVTFKTREEAIAAGRVPCKICNP